MGSLWVAQGADVTGVTVLTLGWVLKALAVLPLITPFPSHPLPGLQRRPAVPRVGLVDWGQWAAGWQQAEPPPSTALWGHLGVLPRRVRAFGAHCREAAHNSHTNRDSTQHHCTCVCAQGCTPRLRAHVQKQLDSDAAPVCTRRHLAAAPCTHRLLAAMLCCAPTPDGRAALVMHPSTSH